ncbi:hypothetical protein ACWGJB_49550 [Streptomyces sp. NPDC054813]
MASGLGAVTMVAGFIAFTETFPSREMDRRLLLARLSMMMRKKPSSSPRTREPSRRPMPP